MIQFKFQSNETNLKERTKKNNLRER